MLLSDSEEAVDAIEITGVSSIDAASETGPDTADRHAPTTRSRP